MGLKTFCFDDFKKAVTDKNLSIEAKGIYCYISCFSNNGIAKNISLKDITENLNIGKDRFYKYRKELIQKGYIKVAQPQNTEGTFKANVYYLNEVN